MSSSQPTTPLPADGRRRRLARRALAFGAVLGFSLLYRSDHLTHWDSWDYAAQAICGHSSDLFLGRWWFVALMRSAYLVGRTLFGLTPLNGYLAMQAACAVCMGGAVVALMVWTYRVTRSARAELLLGLMLVLGPIVGISTWAVMTEGPALLALSMALLAWERAVHAPRRAWVSALVAGLWFGAMVNMREPALLLCAWPIVSCFVDRPQRRGALLVAAGAGALVTFGVGVLGAMAWYPGGPSAFYRNISRWMLWMNVERGLYGYSLLWNAAYVALFVLGASPAGALLLAPALVWRRSHRRRLFWLAVSATAYLVSLLMNHDLAINKRFILPAAWMLMPISAAALSDWTRKLRTPVLRWSGGFGFVLALSLGVLLVAWSPLRNYYRMYHDHNHRMQVFFQAMLKLPPEAVVVSGRGTPIAYHLNRVGRTRFQVIASGWSWPGESLPNVFDEALAKGKPVFVSLDPQDWASGPRKGIEWEDVSATSAQYEQIPPVGPFVQLVARRSDVELLRSPPPPGTREADGNNQ